MSSLDGKLGPNAIGANAEPMLSEAVGARDGWAVYSEGWDPGYGTSADFDDPVGEVEQAEPGDGHVPREEPTAVPLAFIDGVRRVELSLWAEHEATGARVPGLAGAYAVGSVTIRPGRLMRYEGCRVGRLMVWGGGHTGDLGSGQYRWGSAPITSTDPKSCLAHLQERMRRAEGELALEAADGGWNVVLDGPLNRIRSLHSLVAGYVKSHHRRILPESAHMLVPSLAIGERTRMFAAGSDRWTCYIRVGHPPPTASPWGGIARLEFPSTDGLDAACVRASLLASILPAYAGVAHRDERAPVNLQPVKNLEQRLHGSFGRAAIATRAARDAVANGQRLSSDVRPVAIENGARE